MAIDQSSEAVAAKTASAILYRKGPVFSPLTAYELLKPMLLLSAIVPKAEPPANVPNWQGDAAAKKVNFTNKPRRQTLFS